MKEHVVRTVRRLVAEPFRPVGRIRKLRVRQRGFHVCGKLNERGDERIAVFRIAQPCQAAQFGAEQKYVHAACSRA